MAARARGGAAGLSDATSAELEQRVAARLADRASRQAALEARTTAALGGARFEAWQLAERAFAARFDSLGSPQRRFEAWQRRAARYGRPDLPAALECLAHLPTIATLTRALARVDRYGGGELVGPGAGSGQRLLEAMMDGHAEAVRHGEADCPAHLGYFLPQLEQHGRRAKHQQAPKVKDRRIAEGKRPPRRGQAKPGRGPAIGADPRKLPSREEIQQRRRRAYDGRGQ
jgi:hypothetical protein